MSIQIVGKPTGQEAGREGLRFGEFIDSFGAWRPDPKHKDHHPHEDTSYYRIHRRRIITDAGEVTRKLNANLTVDGKYFIGSAIVVNTVPSSAREDKLIYKLLEACVMLSDFPKHGQVIPTQ